jgi:hypothetical protein
VSRVMRDIKPEEIAHIRQVRWGPKFKRMRKRKEDKDPRGAGLAARRARWR